MNEYGMAASVGENDAWNPDHRTSRVEDALARLDETLSKAHAVSSELVDRLNIALQPEEATDEKDGGVSPMLPTSPLVRRVDEAARSAEGVIRRLSRAMDRLDT